MFIIRINRFFTEFWIIFWKSLEKMVKSLEFFFQSYYNKCFTSEIFFVLVKIQFHLHVMEKLCSSFFLRSLEKEIIVLWKSLEKFWIKNLIEPWLTQYFTLVNLIFLLFCKYTSSINTYVTTTRAQLALNTNCRQYTCL